MPQSSFTPLISELITSLAGGVFNYAYSGLTVSPGNKDLDTDTNIQKLRKQWHGWLNDIWNDLSALQQNTWISFAGSSAEGYKLFIQRNINAFLIGEPAISSFTDSEDPSAMFVDIITYAANSLVIKVTLGNTIVPAGCRLLVMISPEKHLPRIISYPADFAPIVTFDEGTDLSSNTTITADWKDFYGVLSGSRRICLNSVVIKKSNGARSYPVFICSPAQQGETFHVIDKDNTSLIDPNSDFVVYQ